MQVLSIVEKKDSLRSGILQKRFRLPFEEVFKLSTIIQKKFLAGIRELEHAKRLALYASFKNEVLTDSIFEYAVTHGKEVFFPRIVREKKKLMFLRVHGKEDMARGSYDIKEPVHHRENHPDDRQAAAALDIIVVPGLAFDTNGNRLGYGRGYYDKALGSLKAKCLMVALAFDFQILDKIPAETHDVKMDRIITENRVINTVGSRQ
ncbi:MAG: 5-formyltetrahydrofolate cyclo-ligase [Deltaproteobacteria bacterium]|nr:5-formyltetrahydrofolate cyclo-ligase [Deltaproteobacteria bacterium]